MSEWNLPKEVEDLMAKYPEASLYEMLSRVYRLGQEQALEAKMFDDNAQKRLTEWRQEQDAKVAKTQGGKFPYYGASGGAYVYTYCPTGLGIVTRVRNDVTKDEIDLTDYQDW